MGCIICCLDDDEMAFLGAPWALYQACAASLGLDVLRLPTPEGLAPLDPTVIDSHLERIIETYTLNGVNVLVHCRGGVGRVGALLCKSCTLVGELMIVIKPFAGWSNRLLLDLEARPVWLGDACSSTSAWLCP